MKKSLLFLSLTLLGSAAVYQNADAAYTPRYKPNWAQEFIGPMNFQLTDDASYAKDLNDLLAMEKQLDALRTELAAKREELKAAEALQTQKIEALRVAKESLETKDETRRVTEERINTLAAEIAKLAEEIEKNESILTLQNVKLEELMPKYNYQNQLLTFAKNAEKDAKDLYDARLKACKDADPLADCSNDVQVRAAKDIYEEKLQLTGFVEEQMAALNEQKAEIDNAIAKANSDIETANKSSKEKVSEKETKTSELATLNAEIPALIDQVSTLTEDSRLQNEKVTQLTNQEVSLAKVAEQNAIAFEANANQFERVRQQLIDEIINYNLRGRDQAKIDAAQEGLLLADKVGGRAGEKDGQVNGNYKGETEGRARDYQAGARTGEAQGSEDGKVAGQDAGRVEGLQKGLAQAGSDEGNASGIAKANNSDAKQKGAAAGQVAGVKQAETDGRTRGTAQGETLGVQAMESRGLTEQTVNGSFAGTFQQQEFPFPGGQHLFYDENLNHSRQLIRLSYTAGYRVTYDPEAEHVFYGNVHMAYKAKYDQVFNEAYIASFGLTYEDEIQRGRNETYEAAYNREYGFAYDEQYKVSFDETYRNPDRNHHIFQNAFAVADKDAYETRYTAIYNGSFASAKDVAYNSNINAQVQKYSDLRKAEVQKIYQNNAVLKFVKMSSVDLGLSGVGAQDAITQPGEKVALNMVISNMGDRAASSASIKLQNNKVINLPSLPARSIVTIKGVAQSSIPKGQALNSNFVENFQVLFPLATSERGVIGRYFDSSANGVLKNAQFTTSVQYPLQVTDLSVLQDLFLGQESALSLTVRNISKADYDSDVRIELDSSAGQGVFSRGFADLALDKGQTANLTDAFVRIDDSSMVFDTVNFGATLTKNGVVIGRIANAGETLVRLAFRDIPGAPVVIFNSQTRYARERFKDALNELGGIDNTAILDISTDAGNQVALGGKLSGKTLFVVDDDRNTLLGDARLERALKNQNILMVFVKDGESDDVMSRALRSVKSLKAATRFPMFFQGEKVDIFSTSPIVNKAAESKISTFAATLYELNKVQGLEETLKMTDAQLMSALGRTVTQESVLNQEAQVVNMTRVFLMRLLEETLELDELHSNANKSKERSAVKKQIKKDDMLLVNRYVKMITDGSKDEKIAGALLYAVIFDGVEEALDDVAPMNQVHKRIKRAIEKRFKHLFFNLENKAKRILKKELGNKKLLEQIRNIRNAFTPFKNT